MLIKINKQSLYIILLLFFIFFFAIQKILINRPGIVETVLSYICYPIIKIQGRISKSIELHYQKKESIEKLKNKLDTIQKENEDLLFENIRLKASLAYLEKVSELIEFKKKINLDSLITAQIMHKQISDNGHFAFIDKGYNEKVEKDMAAIYKNCLIGKVAEVYPKYSKIIYVTDKSCKIAAYCFKTGAIGIYEGANCLQNSTLNYVNHLQNLENDDLVISSGEGLIFPEGFAIGKIAEFKKDQIQYDVNVKPIIDVSNVKYCQLIKK